MWGFREFLERFRPVSVPGAAARPGVPADRVAETSAELAPVLALLDEAADQAERIRAGGRHRAERLRRQARQDAEAVVADAVARAEAVRADAAAHARAAAEAECRRVAQAAQEGAARVRSRARQRMPRYVERAVALAWAAVDGDGPG